jgi:SRSO17 transposase
MATTASSSNLFDPNRWGLPDEAVAGLGDQLRAFWQRYRPCVRTRTRDPSEHCYTYWRGLLTMEDPRNFANMERRIHGGDGQALQQFVSDSPWAMQGMFYQIRTDIAARPALRTGGLMILDESANEKAGLHSAGAGRQYNGRLGKVELSQVATCLAYAHPATGTWAWVDAELFLPEAWFKDDQADLRLHLGIPPEREFATKPALGLQMIRRARAQGVPFEFVACDDLYGRNRAFRAALDAEQVQYAAEVPADTLVYRQPPRVGLPQRRHRRGPKPTRLRVLSRHQPCPVRDLVRSRQTVWQRVQVRHTERGLLEADFAVTRVWTLTEERQVRGEWLVTRCDADGKLTYVLLNAPADTPARLLIERSCQRYFTERTFQDAKSELGWADFQAQKYRAWEHHTALTAAALWFVAEVKLDWRERYARDPELLQQLEVEVLPALSTANVRELLQAVLPVPHLTRAEARQVVATHLVHRARSTSSRLKTQRKYDDSS